MIELIAHRGASADVPENTLAAVELAWRQGADAVEVDVRLSADGQIVAMHDPSTLRTGAVDRPIAEQTLADLRRLDVGRWKGEQWAGERIPTLVELLASVPQWKRIYIEIKCGAEIAVPLAVAIRGSGLAAEQVVAISFSADVLAAVRGMLPAIETYLIVDFKRTAGVGAWRPDIERLLADAAGSGLSGLDLLAARALDPAVPPRIRAAGLGICVWTVDSPADARRLVELGIERITTNRPGWLREQLHL